MSTRIDELLRRVQEAALNPSAPLRYGVAVLAALAATDLRFEFQSVFLQTPYWSFGLAVVVAAGFGGRGPALITTSLSAFAAYWFFLRAPGSFAIANPTAAWGLVLFITLTGAIGLLIGSLSESSRARTRAEENLRESETRFRTMADSIPQLCSMADSSGNFFWHNWRWYEYTGLSFEELKGSNWLAALAPEAAPEARAGLQHSIATGEPFEMVLPLRGADGNVRPFLTRAVPVHGADGKVKRWVATYTDISEQRRTEDALRRANSEGLARAAELQAIMDAMPVAMFMTHDPECRYLFGNRRAYELLREPPGSNLSVLAPEGKRPKAFRIIRDGHEVSPYEMPLRRAASTGEAVYDYEMDLALDDGSRDSLIGNAVPLLDAEGHPRGAVGVFIDITERKQNEERLRHAQKLGSIGLLAGGVAHDFNNLLTVIIGSADAALTKYPFCDEVRHILTASERAAHLTRQLLAYAGKGQFVTKTFNLTDLVSRSRELLLASIPKRVDLVFHLPEQELLVKADPSQIEQILMNLIINAAEAIPPQTDGRIEIATGTSDVTAERVRDHEPAYDTRPGRFVYLKVTDNGSGMDEATQAQIFDPFFSTKFTGRGLGLAAVQGIVRSCKGFIEVESSRGAGSKFQVFLPASGKQSAPEGPAASRPGPSRREERGHATILVVDDEDLVRRFACSALQSRGYQVLEAKNGRDALEVVAAASQVPSAALVDLAMPVMGGEELVPILRRDYPGMRIIVTSGYSEEDAGKRFPPGSVCSFLQKPYVVATLLQKVQESLNSGGPNEKAPAAA